MWGLRVAEGNVARLEFPPGDGRPVRVSIEKAATGVSYDIQLNLPRLRVEADHRYTVEFVARADSARSLFVGLSLGRPPWTNLGSYFATDLSTEWTKFEQPIVAASDADNARLHFDAGENDASFELAFVALRSLDGRAVEPEIAIPRSIPSARLDDPARYRAEIPPVPDGVDRLLWSVMIPTYNCARYLRETLASVLAQDPGPDVMQIEVVDDHSTRDDPEAVVREMGRGRVAFFRQSRNVGHVENFASCLRRSRGHLIHLLHGDDFVVDGFYRSLGRLFEAYPEIGAAFCRHTYIDPEGATLSVSELERDDSGVLEGWLEKIATGQRIATPSIAVRQRFPVSRQARGAEAQ